MKEIRSYAKIQRRDLTEAEKSAGNVGAVIGIIPYNSDSGELRDRGLNQGRPFREQIAPGAFTRSISEDKDIMGFIGHTDDPLASFARAGANLTFTDTADGLQWEAVAPDTTACRDLMRLVDSGVIKGTSFEFSLRSADGEKWEKRDGTDLRTITDARLYAVNPVAWPAYDAGALSVSMRSSSPAALKALADAVLAEIEARSAAKQAAEQPDKDSAPDNSQADDKDRELRRLEAFTIAPKIRSNHE